MNDRTAAELISYSLSEPLSDSEAAQLSAYLNGSAVGREYAKISAEIQSAMMPGPLDELESGPGLSPVARARIQNRIDLELMRVEAEKQGKSERQSLDRRVAEENTDYLSNEGDQASGSDVEA